MSHAMDDDDVLDGASRESLATNSDLSGSGATSVAESPGLASGNTQLVPGCEAWEEKEVGLD